MKVITTYAWVALIITLIGGINWGLVGLVDLNLIAAIFGIGLFARLIYIIVGVAAGYLCYLIYLDKFSKPATPPPPPPAE